MPSPALPAIRLCCLHKGCTHFADEVTLALSNNGINCDDHQQQSEHYCTLITFNDETDPDLLQNQIQVWKRNQGSRVVAINLNKQPLGLKQTWELMQSGVQEVLNWMVLPHPDKVILSRLERWMQIEQILDSPKVQGRLAGSGHIWRSVLRGVVEAAAFSQAPILILGESGTGKELVAQLIHDIDKRPFKQDYVLLDCSSIAPELSGSEFFGHEKGAFTNAIATRDGAFSLADKGTLFLDEIGELPPRLQAELLRVIQEGMYKRVGSNTWKKASFRLVCATNRDLKHQIQRHRFREDLYYRISTWVFTLPPLRERQSDIPELVRFFLKMALQTDNIPPIDPLVMAYLETREYPGNLRELRQLVTRLVARHVGPGPITVGDLAEVDRPQPGQNSDPFHNHIFVKTLHTALKHGLGLKDIVAEVSHTAKNLAIQDAGGNLQLAAQMLQVTDRTLQQHQAIKRDRPLEGLMQAEEANGRSS